MGIILRILLLAVLLVVLATLSSVQLLKATSGFLGKDELCSEWMQDVRSSLRDSGLFLIMARRAD